MWQMGAVCHVQGSLGFVHWRGMLHVVLLIGDVGQVRRRGDGLSNTEKVRAWRAKNKPARKPRVAQQCSRCSSLDHKRPACTVAGVIRNKTTRAARRRT